MLSDEEIRRCYEAGFAHNGLLAKHSFPRSARAIESAATAPLLARIAELERELEEARKDAERLDYIQKNARNDPKMDGNHVWWPTTFNKALKGPTIRAAIDAAIRSAIKEQT